MVKDGERFRLDYDRPKSIGRVRSFFGNVGILLRGYCYIRTLGPDGLREVSENAVLNANYLLARLKDVYEVPHGDRCMHEFVASARSLRRERRISAMDIAKRLLDFGYHAPTVYFPLVVPEALMIEPTETESKETLDAFADALREDSSGGRRISCTTPRTRWRSAGPTRSRRPRSRSCGGKAHLPAAAVRHRRRPHQHGRRRGAAAKRRGGRGFAAFLRLVAADREPRLFPMPKNSGTAIRHWPRCRSCAGPPAARCWCIITNSRMRLPCREGLKKWAMRMHQIIVAALAAFGIDATLHEPAGSEQQGGPLCFHHFTPGDVLIGRAKVVGSASADIAGRCCSTGESCWLKARTRRLCLGFAS